MLKYIRYSVRGLIRTPGFTVAVLLTMGLGIGANVAMFSLLNTVLLRPLPYKDPERVVQIWETKRLLKSDRVTVAAPNYENWRTEARLFEGMSLVKGAVFHLRRSAGTIRVQGLSVSGDFFQALGAQAALGRTFTPQEEGRGTNRVLVLSHRFWKEEFGGDSKLVGQGLSLDDGVYTVIGVMPADFYFPEFGRKWDLWTPIVLSAGEQKSRDAHVGGVVARMRAGVTLRQAQSEMDRIAARLEQEFPASNAGAGVRVLPISEQIAGAVRPTLIALAGAVGLVLLIACSNVGSLLLVRSAGRRKEIGIRIALGARWRDLLAQLVTEGLVLAGTGGAVGVFLAWTVLPLLKLIPASIPRIDQAMIDTRVLLFSVVVAVSCGMLFGLAPALGLIRSGAGSASMGNRRGVRALHALVIAEVTLAFILLAAAGLLLESLFRVLSVDPGFRPDSVMTARVSLPESLYTDSAARLGFQDLLLDGVRRLPQVSAAGLTTNLPIGGTDWSMYFSVEGLPLATGEVMAGEQRLVSPGYFAAMGIPLLSGRTFDDRDTPDGMAAAVIDEALAKKFFAGGNPIGRRVKWGRPDDADFPWWFTIVGVVGSVRHRTLESPASPELYMCSQQMAGRLAMFAPSDFALVVRSKADRDSLAGAVRSVVSRIDGEVPVTDVQTMERVLSHSLAPREFNLVLLGAFAALALILAWIGTYGVMAYSTALRSHELAIRMAIGSDRGSILRLVLSRCIRLTGAGIAFGFAGCWLLARVLSPLLYGVGPHSSAALAAAAIAVSGSSLVAGYLPARKAAGADPAIALRAD